MPKGSVACFLTSPGGFHYDGQTMKRVWICSLVTMVVCVLLGLFGPVHAMSFRLSAIGYHPQGAKVAVLEDVPADRDVSVVLFDPERRNPRMPLLVGTTVYKFHKPASFKKKSQQGPPTRSILLDFTDFQVPGTFELRVEGTEIKSPPIKISDYLYWDALRPVVKSFYFQRCGQEIEDRAVGVYHAACHLKDADFIRSPQSRSPLMDDVDVVGGWHHGGDYTKYTTSTALSIAKLLAIHEWNARPYKYFRLEYPLHEISQGQANDLLHEVKVGLDWLLVMQRRDGAFYRKVAGLQWPGNQVGPDDDLQKRYIYGISTLDTANAAAALAMAAREYRKSDLGFSIRCLRAAEKAWIYLQNQPQLKIERTDRDQLGSGEFIEPGMTSDLSQRLWAATELYITTGKPEYHQYFTAQVRQMPLQRFSWQNPMMQGAVDYVLYAPDQNPQITAWLRGQVVQLADAIVKDVATAGLPWPSGLKRYERASNRAVVERAAILLAAYRMTDQARYRDAASRSMSYLLGVNPFGHAYVSGLGDVSIQKPAHRWMSASKKTIPGFLVDGPDEVSGVAMVPVGQGAASYVDDPVAASVNESTLLNNAGLAYVLAVLNDVYNVGGQQDENRRQTPLDVQLAPSRPEL